MTLTISAITLSAIIPSVAVYLVMRSMLNAERTAREAAERKLAVRKKVRSNAAKKAHRPNPVKASKVLGNLRSGQVSQIRPRESVVANARAANNRRKMRVAA